LTGFYINVFIGIGECSVLRRKWGGGEKKKILAESDKKMRDEK
jgi:hypothetical protein